MVKFQTLDVFAPTYRKILLKLIQKGVDTEYVLCSKAHGWETGRSEIFSNGGYYAPRRPSSNSICIIVPLKRWCRYNKP